jgi:hypothetical protein
MPFDGGAMDSMFAENDQDQGIPVANNTQRQPPFSPPVQAQAGFTQGASARPPMATSAFEDYGEPFGASPDGLGDDVVDDDASLRAGVTAIGVVAAGALGFFFGGLAGGAAGVLGAGAVSNVVAAQRDWSAEDERSRRLARGRLVVAVIGLGLGGAAGAYAYKHRSK